MKKSILILLSLCLIGLMSFSQSNIAISGKVTNEKKEPLAQASVMVKNSKAGAITDEKGNFRVFVTSLPVTLQVSYSNLKEQEIIVSSTNEISISMEPSSDLLDAVVLQSKGIPTKMLNYTGTADILPLKKIRQLPTTSIYDATVYSKGIDLTSSSLTFKTPSSRGFNGSGSTRVNQIVDGMDNQAPGLNFFVGNFAGLTDLDIESVELLPGASSALYGPGGMNGTILMNSKNPFKYQGLSVQLRQGVMHVDKGQRDKASAYNDYSLRWAKAFNEKFAVKIGAQYISAKDWLANDSTNYDRSGTSGKLKSGSRTTDPNYDGVNVYGDETSVDIFPFLSGALPAGHPLIEHIDVSRTGYKEIDVIDPETKNIKLSGALHYKLSDKIEALLMGYWSTGNTVYTDDNRYALKGIKIGQYKFELKHKKWFLRSYTTQEDAGEAYSATVATQYLNEAWKRSFNPANINGSWYPQFTGAYLMARGGGADKSTALNIARSFADQGRPAAGSTQFNQIFDVVRKTPIPNGGLFKEKSQLWMTEGQYTFGDAVKSAEIIAGASYKNYILNSYGTLFIDTLKPISINEVGAYVQVTRKLFAEKLTLTSSGRFDKNENFKAQFTPRFSALVKVAKDNNLRMSYQTAYRFPGNLSQWIRLDIGGDYLLLGGLPWVMDYMNAGKDPVHQINPKDGTIDPNPYIYKEFKPETMRSFEIGYKGLIKNKLLIDAYAYFGSYKDFIGRIGLYQPATGNAYSIVTNSNTKVKTHGFGLGMDYRMKDNYSVFFNVYSDVITDVPAGFKSYFNTSKYRFNAGFANDGLGKSKRIGFNIMMRWQDAFEWEGELANGPLKAFATADAQVSYQFPKIKSTLRLGGTNIFNHYYKNAYANPAIGGVYYTAFIYNF
jgi:outer membrane receptor protein involved in Fe transport